MLDDLSALRDSIRATHYDPFAYTSEATFEARYQQLAQSIVKPNYSLLETVNLYQSLISTIKNGHSELDFPVQPYLQYAENGGTIFPLEIAFEHDKPLVRKNYSSDQSIEIGAQIKSINGVAFADILEQIYPLISAERRYFKNSKLELFSFPRYFWRAFGETKHYVVELESNGVITSHRFDAVDVFSGFESIREEIIGSNRYLKFFDDSAYLYIANFSGDEAEFKQFIDSSFAKIKQKNIANLIIDLRNNAGGNDSHSDYLVSYLADKPFKWHANFHLKTSKLLKQDTRKNRDLTNPYWQAIMAHEDGSRFEYVVDSYQPQSEQKRFTGQAYVLINRQSHSQAAVTAAQIQDYGWATLVGEETGDYPSLYASQFHYTLPKTGIFVKISKGFIVRVNGSSKQQGVIADIVIKDHLLDDNDEILDTLLKKISASK
ncbi:S41 family peptidase [Thalassotalea sp. HSM 43]|uniref:S41 family peptidase n=1 Tax=Thalassotalea sp. HSM 43 TaxID=2552945 RepID=UPI00167A763B|nr:S41 family peptidase [Thalassotalea sp. HSM 43]